MSGIIGLDHVLLGMPDGGEEAARRFYGALLGLREVPKPAEYLPRGGLWFIAPGVALHIGVEADFRPVTVGHPAFVIGDLAGLRARLIEVGVDVADETQVQLRRLYVDDPFGNKLEFVDARDSGFTERGGRPGDS